jgi:hypothetical protein
VVTYWDPLSESWRIDGGYWEMRWRTETPLYLRQTSSVLIKKQATIIKIMITMPHHLVPVQSDTLNTTKMSSSLSECDVDEIEKIMAEFSWRRLLLARASAFSM